jgi:hypothetical protein
VSRSTEERLQESSQEYGAIFGNAPCSPESC